MTAMYKTRKCRECDKKFEPKNYAQKWCSIECYKAGSVERQRQWVSGNWRGYFNRLLTIRNRRQLTLDMLLELLEQQGGRCALTGVKMTNILVANKKTWTNASIDRIVSGGPYIKSNIQLVCSAVNVFRSEMSIEEFREWCRLVTNFKGLPHGTRLPSRVRQLPGHARAEEEPGKAQRRPSQVPGRGKGPQGGRQGR